MRGITGRHFSISERMRVLSSHAWREKGGGDLGKEIKGGGRGTRCVDQDSWLN
jgi:hypothetical protein